MGCESSRDAQEDEKINIYFTMIGLLRFDDFFDKASQLLEDAEKIRQDLEDNREKGAEITTSYLLKDPKFVDDVQVFFWTLSAESNGKISDSGVDVGSNAPYITFDSKNVSADTKSLYQALIGYINTVTEGPETFKDIIAKLQEMAKLLPQIRPEDRDEILNSSLSMKQKHQATANLHKNITKLFKELKKCQDIGELLKQASIDLEKLIPKLGSFLSKADEVGAKAAAENLKKPSKIFAKFHTGARMIEAKKA